jgi:hypothetical protein
MSIIANVNGAAAKITTMGMATIGRDATAVVSARGTVAGRGSTTSGARSKAWPCNDEGGQRIVTTQAYRYRGGGGAEECGQQMQDAKKVKWLPTTLIVKDRMAVSRKAAMCAGGNRLMEEGGGK